MSQKKSNKKPSKKIQNEALADWIGHRSASGLKKLFKPGSGMSRADMELRDRWVDRFISTAQTELQAAIDGDIVDPNIKPAAQPAPAAPAQPAAQPAPAVSTAAAPSNPKPRYRPDPQTGKPVRVAEDRFEKLNIIFEAIIQEQEETAFAKQSISDWLMTKWWPSYMRNTEYQSHAADVKRIFDEVQSTFAKDGGKAALQKLGQRAYVLQMDAYRQQQAGGRPSVQRPVRKARPQSQQQPVTQTQQQPSQPAQPTSRQSADDLVMGIYSNLAQLKTTDPQAWKDIIQAIGNQGGK